MTSSINFDQEMVEPSDKLKPNISDYCPYCGSILNPDYQFCKNCGYSIS